MTSEFSPKVFGTQIYGWRANGRVLGRFLVVMAFLLPFSAMTEEVQSGEPQSLGPWAEAASDRALQELDRGGLYTRTIDTLNVVAAGAVEGVPFISGGTRLFLRREAGADKAGLYLSEDGKEEAVRLFHPDDVDPSGFSAIKTFLPSRDGQWVAISVNKFGTRWNRIYFLSLASRKLSDEVIENVKFIGGGISWALDGSGLYYSTFDVPVEEERYFAPDTPQIIRYHDLGTPVASDKTLMVFDDPAMRARPYGLPGGEVLLRLARGSQGDVLMICAADQFPCAVRKWAGDFSYHMVPMGNHNGELLLLTDRFAPHRKLISTSLDDFSPENWTTVIPESEVTILGARKVGDNFVVLELENAITRLRLKSTDSKREKVISLPEPGTVRGPFGGMIAPLPDDRGFIFPFNSHIRPPTLFSFDFEKEAYEAVDAQGRSQSAETLEAATEVHYLSWGDEQKVPVFVTRSTSARTNQPAPTLLYGYGGWVAPWLPYYDPKVEAWLKSGGVFALAILPGGGEFGEQWHEAGMRENKTRVFAAFEQAARYLIDAGVTTREELAITGISNGGLLTAAALTRNPDSYGAVVVRAGAVDLLAMEKYTYGIYSMAPELGSARDPRYRSMIESYSPMQQIKGGKEYPATLVLHGEYDSSVVPIIGARFARALAKAQAGQDPVYFSLIRNSGHNRGYSRSSDIEWAALELAFLFRTFGMKPAIAGE